MPTAPGAYVTVTTAPPSPNGNAPTGTWFVTGQTYQGPVATAASPNAAVPVSSMTDFVNYFGPRQVSTTGYNSTLLYDSLDTFFNDGGVLAYVSRVAHSDAATASVTLVDQATPTPNSTLKISACGPGSWGNSVKVKIAAGSATGSYTITVLYTAPGSSVATQVGLTSPNLFTPADAVTWYNSQPSYQTYITVTNLTSPASGALANPATGTFSLIGGSDTPGSTNEADWTTALTAFNDSYGPGQVSAPGHTTPAGYQALLAHAIQFNRVALLDAIDSSSATNLESQASSIQSTALGNGYDSSYAALFAPWVVIPGVTNTVNPGSTSPIPNRTVPPSALAAAKMAFNDRFNDANRAAAGPSGQSKFAIGVTNTYPVSDSTNSGNDRGTLNIDGVNIILQINGVTTLYGFRSLSLNANWYSLSSVRMRMQMVYDFNQIALGYVFGEIDGKGQIYSQLGGALAGKCQQYWLNNSLYGVNPQDSFLVNTGPQVNTPATIAAGQINAQVLVRLSPTAEVVTINVVKYLTNATLPTY